MSDENRPPIGWNTDDDNLNFDISLDPNTQAQEDNLNLFDEPKTKSDFEPNFDININADDKPTQANKEINTQENSPEISDSQETILDTNPIQQDIPTNTDELQDINTQSQIQEPNQATQVPNDQSSPYNDSQNIQINWEPNNLDQINKDYNPDLQSVDTTIQQLQEAKEQWITSISSEELSQIPTINNPIVQINEPQEVQIQPQDTGWINLDEILPQPQSTLPETTIQTPVQQTTQTQQVNKVPFPESIQKSLDPYDLTKNTNQVQTKNKEHKKHLLMMVGIWSVCLLVGFFILKTMYPVQFGSNNWDTQYVPIPQEEIQPQEESNPFQENSLDNTGDIAQQITQETDTDIDQSITNTGDMAQEITQDTIQNDIETVQQTTWDNQDHNITDQTDPFGMLDNFQTDEEIKKQATITSLKDFQLYLKKKSEDFVNQIENWEILDISSLDTDLAQLSQFLQKLQDLENESSQNIQKTDSQQPETQQ
jgi:hypothetical protein